MNFDLKENIRVAIKERCFMQSAIAGKANMSPVVLLMVLGKKRKLEANELYDLCEAMEISPSELRTRYESQKPM